MDKLLRDKAVEMAKAEQQFQAELQPLLGEANFLRKEMLQRLGHEDEKWDTAFAPWDQRNLFMATAYLTQLADRLAAKPHSQN